jgi:hypothetical protein
MIRKGCRQSPNALIALISAALVATPAGVQARAPSNLGDLVGARASSAEHQMQERGYFRVNGSRDERSIWSYWWNPVAKRCVSARVTEGRFSAIHDAGSADCSQRGHDDGGGDGSGAAAIAIGAAALIGLAALSHQQHHHDDNRHHDDVDKEAEFERGYRDGLYAAGYHNYNRGDVYSDGYEKGARQRDHEISHRARDGHHSGYQRYVNVRDLIGEKRSHAESQLERRGFIKAGGGKGRERTYSSWWQPETRQCINVESHDGRVRTVEDAPGVMCS